MSTATALPESIAAGTTVTYRRSLADYPASGGWGLVVYLAGASVVSSVAVAAGADFDVTFTAVQTAALLPGNYTWVERVTKGAEKYEAARGSVVILPDVATAGAGTLQSWEERTLTVVEAALSGQLTGGIAEYQIAGRAVKKIPLEELIALRDTLKQRVDRRANGGRGRKLLLRFGPVGNDR